MNATTLPRLLTEAEVAEYLDVNPETVARERRKGRLPFRKIGGSIRFTQGDVQEYVDRCASTSKTAKASGTSAGRTVESPGGSALAKEIASGRI